MPSATSRTPIPLLVELLWIPGFLAIAIFLQIPQPGPARVALGLGIFTTVWSYALTHWVAQPSFLFSPMFGFAVTVRWVYMVVLDTAEVGFFRGPSSDKEESPLKFGLWKKLKWSADLWFSWRGVGWDWEVSNIPRPVGQIASRGRWLATQTGAAIANFTAQKVIIDHVFCRYYPSSNTVEAFTSLPLIHRLWISVIHLTLGWLFLANANRLIAIIAVATRLSVPENCPPSFGSLTECYTVRNFWGKAWHQTFKWYFNTTGDLVATSIGAKKGTLLRKYTKLHVAFLMSGIQHYVATLFVPSPSWAWAMIGQMVLYAIIITIEDGLKSLGQQVGLKPGRKLIITPVLRRNFN
ncbi:MBOAT_2 domain-containing protein [Trichoderma simmonsii]|uniref:MBOAT_2 domain-containing protein n=1 Tax=Trichoderma simmonsii TaxID=1491479 RepID=A0A8G0PB65_9HYPO|nr:MBOAT_2 domain-containing protein [Trichoderma simmonsii]